MSHISALSLIGSRQLLCVTLYTAFCDLLANKFDLLRCCRRQNVLDRPLQDITLTRCHALPSCSFRFRHTNTLDRR